MKLFISLSLLIISVSLCAQNPVRDVIYLNNGSIIRGNIIEISNNKTIKIESCDNILVFDMTEVQKVTKEEIPIGQNIKLSSKPGGYINITSFGVLAGLKESSSISPVSIEMVNAYRFRNKYSFGIGLGIDLYGKVHIPVFLDCRYQLFNRDISPLIILKGGYSLPAGGDRNTYYYTENYSKGGPMLGTGAGIIFRINNNNQVIVGLGYRYQQLITTEVQRNNDVKWTYDHSVKYNRLEIKFGFYFD